MAESASQSQPKSIPHLKGRWPLGSAREYLGDPAGFMDRGFEQFGDIFSCDVAGVRLIFTRDPRVVNDMNVTHWDECYKPALAKRLWKPFLGNGLVPADGPLWKRQHKLIMPAFHKRRIDAYGAIMAEQTRRMIGRWRDGERRDFNDEMTDLTLAIVVKTLFDADIEGDAGTIREALLALNAMLLDQIHRPIRFPDWVPTPKNRRKMRDIRAIESVIHRFIEERRADQRDRGDLLSHMVFVTDDEGGMSDKQLRDEMMTLVFAGHETTAHQLTWTWYLLAKNPAKAAKLREEVDRVLSGGDVTVEKLPELTYTEMVVKEATRLLPSVWRYGREPQRDMRLGDYVLPKDVSVTVAVSSMGRNPEYYDEPLQFRPERWTREFEKSLPRGQYVPFAAGPRVCLGKQFAMMEMRIILAALMQAVEPNVTAGFEPDFVAELSQHPGERGLPMDVRFRHAVAAE